MPDRLAVISRVAELLRTRPNAITPRDIAEVKGGTGVSDEYAFALLLAELCGLDAAGSPDERALFRECFIPMVCSPDKRLYERDACRERLGRSEARAGAFSLRELRYEPCEMFPCGELMLSRSGYLLPRIGFFTEEYKYPALMEGDTLWMSVTPNEIETMREPIARACGRVAAYGLGMGYYALTALMKPEVDSVTVIERDESVISLFKSCILPRFDVADRLTIIRGDAIEYAREQAPRERFDCVFADLWHDAGDGIPIYRELKALETPGDGTRFDYWIEPSMRLYMRFGVGGE